MMKIAAAIVSYNSDKVFRCYESVKDQLDFIIIVDNGTKDDSITGKLQQLEKTNQKCKVILNAENLGIASALNAASFYAKEHGFEWIMTLDQDSEIPQGSVAKIMSDFDSLPEQVKEKCAIVAYKYSERSIHNPDENAKKENFQEVKIILTSGNIIKIPLLDKINYFNEKLFIDQVDHDLDFRLRKEGYTILQSNNYGIIHELGTAKKRMGFVITNHSHLRRYYMSRNSMYILKRYFFFEPRLVARLFIGSIFGGIFKITFFEQNKLTKYKYILSGIKDGILNRYGKRYNP